MLPCLIFIICSQSTRATHTNIACFSSVFSWEAAGSHTEPALKPGRGLFALALSEHPPCRSVLEQVSESFNRLLLVWLLTLTSQRREAYWQKPCFSFRDRYGATKQKKNNKSVVSGVGADTSKTLRRLFCRWKASAKLLTQGWNLRHDTGDEAWGV